MRGQRNYTYTSQREVRAAFWAAHPEAVRKPGGHNAQVTDTRVAFVDFLDSLERNGCISEELAGRATL